MDIEGEKLNTKLEVIATKMNSLEGAFTSVRTDLKTDIADIRSDIKETLKQIRDSFVTHDQIGILRTNLESKISDTHQEIRAIDKKYEWTQKIVNGAVGLILSAVFVALVSLVVISK